MLVVTATLSIAPGHLSAVTRVAGATLGTAPVGRHCLWALSAEVGEVNTLLVAFVGDTPDELLGSVRQWIAQLRATDAGPRLRHAHADLCDTAASLATLRALPAMGAVLAQTLGAAEVSTDGTVSLAQLTGLQGRHVVFTPVATHDEALAISRRTVDADAVEVFDSTLWMPVRLQINESPGP